MVVPRINSLDTHTPEQGFTIVEILVTTIIVALFVTGFFQAYVLLESQRVNILQQAKASDIAYSNLGKYPVKPSALTCPATSTTSGATLGDSSVNSATSPSLYNFIPETNIVPLGSNTQQVIKAYAPNGCNGSDFVGGVVKIVSTVTYGSNGKVEHVSYVQAQ